MDLIGKICGDLILLHQPNLAILQLVVLWTRKTFWSREYGERVIEKETVNGKYKITKTFTETEKVTGTETVTEIEIVTETKKFTKLVR